MLAGHGTIAIEILEQVPFVEAVVVPVGTGGLAAATAVVIKQVKPSCLVYVSIFLPLISSFTMLVLSVSVCPQLSLEPRLPK